MRKRTRKGRNRRKRRGRKELKPLYKKNRKEEKTKQKEEKEGEEEKKKTLNENKVLRKRRTRKRRNRKRSRGRKEIKALHSYLSREVSFAAQLILTSDDGSRSGVVIAAMSSPAYIPICLPQGYLPNAEGSLIRD